MGDCFRIGVSMILCEFRVSGDPRFWTKVKDNGECWEWQAALTGDGYGAYWTEGKTAHAHRVSWTWEHPNNPIPKDMVVDHICRNRKCVRPDHLRIIANVENVMCGLSNPALNARKTHCLHGHPLSGENLRIRPEGKRQCLICRLNHKRKQNERLRKVRHMEASL